MHEDGEKCVDTAAIRRVTLAGMLINLLLSVVKFAGGILGNSEAVVADSIHSLSDLSTDIALLVGLRYWAKPPDEDHPYGHGRFETMVTMIIGGALALAGILLSYRAVTTIHEPNNTPPCVIAFCAALLSVVVKEFLYRWTVRWGQKLRSPAIMANAWHHRSDAFSSIPVALAVGFSIIRPEWYLIDHIAAAVVGIFILKASWAILIPALKELVDTGSSSEQRELIKSLAMEVEGVKSVHAIRTRNHGSGLHVDLHLLVCGNMTVCEGHEIATKTRDRLLEEKPEFIDVLVHVEPFEMHDEQHD